MLMREINLSITKINIYMPICPIVFDGEKNSCIFKKEDNQITFRTFYVRGTNLNKFVSLLEMYASEIYINFKHIIIDCSGNLYGVTTKNVKEPLYCGANIESVGLIFREDFCGRKK